MNEEQNKKITVSKLAPKMSNFHFDPIQLSGCVYVLELEDECIYVGATMNFNLRMAQHFAGRGSRWTILHKPKKVLEIVYPMTAGLENEITQRYMGERGKEKVRGGSWCQVDRHGATSSKRPRSPPIILLDSSESTSAFLSRRIPTREEVSDDEGESD